MFKNKLGLGVAVAVVAFGSSMAKAQPSVIGQLSSSHGVSIHSGESQQTINQQQFPYIQGDVVSTKTSSGANIVFADGSAALTIAADSTAAVLNEMPAEVLLTKGGVRVQLKSADAVTFDTPAGRYVVTSEAAINAVAAFDGGEFALVSQAGNLVVESENGDVITYVDANDAFAYAAETGARAVDVQLLGSNTTRNTLLLLLGVGAAILIIDDDDDPASPS